jgi:energy-coupling factor transport system permease protein
LLAFLTSVRAFKILGPWLLIKIYLILVLLLLVCLAGVALNPSLRKIRAPRPADSAGPYVSFTVYPALRMAVSANLALSLAMSTPTSELSKLIGAAVKPDWLFIPLSVVLRFIGTFLAELTLVRDALMVRTRKSLLKTFFTKPWLLWRGFLVPMTFRTLAAADDLAISLEMRGLRRQALFWPRPPLVTKKDAPSIVIGLLTVFLCLALSSPKVILTLNRALSW